MSSSPEVPPTLSTNDQGSVRAFARLAIQEGFYFVLRRSPFCCAFVWLVFVTFFDGTAFSILLLFATFPQEGSLNFNFFGSFPFFIALVIIWPFEKPSAQKRSAP
jgi:hypothetical protein